MPDSKSNGVNNTAGMRKSHGIPPLLLCGTYMESFDESIEQVGLKEALEAEPLYGSMWKCKRGKMHKASVANYVIHGIDRTLELAEQLQFGKYKPRKPRKFTLYYPKVRPCSSTHIRDRIVQRSLNDLVIYPQMTHSFIWDNMACQQGKGTTRAMDRLNESLHRMYINNGNTVDGLFVLQADIHGYYRNMRHDKAEECFARHLDYDTVKTASDWLQYQYPYPVGYEPGSQMVQILGISFLDPFDHVIKERLRAHVYGRYMDDFYIISNSVEFLEHCKEVMSDELTKIGLELHPKKTRIYPLKNGIKVLGFTFKLTDTGKVLRIIDSKNVKHERKKLVKMAAKVKKGEMTVDKLYQCYGAWKAHAELGNTYQLLLKMDEYVEELLRPIEEQKVG